MTNSQYIDLLNEISAVVQLPMEMGSIVQGAAQALSSVLHVPQISVLLLSRLRQEIVVAYDQPEPGAASIGGQMILLSDQEVVTRLQQLKRPYYAANWATFGAEFNIAALEYVLRPSAHSLLFLPLLVRDEWLGYILCSAIQQPRTYTDEEVALAQIMANVTAVQLEHARLLAREQYRSDVQTQVSELLQALNAQPDVHNAFPHIVRVLRKLTACNRFSLILFNSEKTRFQVTILDAPNPITLLNNGPYFDLKDTAVGPNILADKLHYTPNMQTESQLPIDQQLYQAGVLSRLVLPLKVEGNIKGALNIGWDKLAGLDPEVTPALTQITDALALAVERSELLEAQRRQTQQARTLQSLGSVLASSLNLNEVLETVAEGVLQLMDVSACNIMLFEPPDNLVWRVSLGLPNNITQIARQTIGQSLSGWIATHKKPLRIADMTQDARMKYAGLAQQHGLFAYMGTPMEVRGRFIGVLEINDKQIREFTDEEESMLVTFAGQAAVAVENARLYQEVIQQATELATLYQSAQALAVGLNRENLLVQLAEHITQAVHGTSGFVLEYLETEQALRVLAEYYSPEAKLVERTGDLNAVYRLKDYPTFRRMVTDHEVVVVQMDQAKQPVPLSSRESSYLRRSEVKSVLLLPVMQHGRILGIAEIWDSQQGREFSQQEVLLAQTIAQHAASALENAQLFDRVQQQAANLEEEIASSTAELRQINEQLQVEIQERSRVEAVLRGYQDDLESRTEALLMLNTIADSVYRSFDAQTVANKALEAVCSVAKFKAGAVFLLDKEKVHLDLIAYRGFSRALATAGQRLPVGRSLSGRTVQLGTAVARALTHDTKIMPTIRNMLLAEGYGGLVSVPLFYQQDVLGVLNVFLVDVQELKSHEQRLLESVGKTVGMALINARYVNQIEREIHEREQVEQALTIYAAELERSNRELQDFAYIASHDLQEPLRKIQTFGDRLQHRYADVLDKRGNDYLDRMQTAAARMRVLIDDLLIFSRVTTGGEPFQDVDLNVLVAGVLSDLEVQIEQTKGVITVDNLPVMEVDASQIRSLFQNLISNALKFAREDTPPQVRVWCEPVQTNMLDVRRPRFYRFFVADNGIGFDKKYAGRIFSLFERLHTRTEYEGTGMGLAICRKIVDRHGGQISASSELGEGALFEFTLPVKQG